MGTSGAAKFPLLNDDVAANSETTVEIKIKTLDSQTYTLRVNKCVPVPDLKEKIATVTGVLSEQQRLICRGRVLKDDQLLSAYHVEDGHTLHLVVRPPQQASSPFLGSENLPSSNSASGSMPPHRNQATRTVVVEAVNVDHGYIDSTVLSRIVGSILSSLGETNSGIGHFGSGLQEIISERLPRPFGDTAAPTTQYQQNMDQQTSSRFPSAVSLGPQNITVIPDSLTTLRQYLDHMKNEFRTEMPDRDHSNISEFPPMDNNECPENISESHQSSGRDDLTSPMALAEILRSTRRMLAEQAEDCLLHLARQLENHTGITDTLTRSSMQSSAIRSGFLLQNLGSLLLELGRTTMTLRLGQIPSEAVVNAGPAVFISASGPNPVMVQPVPFYPGSSFGGTHMGSTSPNLPEGGRGSAFLPRNIDIRIHTGRESSDSARTSATGNFIHQAASDHPGSATLAGESGVRVVPVRTVLVPARISNVQSEMSGNSVALLYPLLARVRHQNTGSPNDASDSQVSQEPFTDSTRQTLESFIQSSVQGTHVSSDSITGVSGLSLSPSVPAEPRGAYHAHGESSLDHDVQNVGQVSVSQILSGLDTWFRGVPPQQFNAPQQLNQIDHEGQGSGFATELSSSNEAVGLDAASRSVNDQAVLFSNFLHQLMPLITQENAIVPNVPIAGPNPSSSSSVPQGVSSNDPSSSQLRRDPPETPNAKRSKSE